jgi:hypothetical protein
MHILQLKSYWQIIVRFLQNLVCVHRWLARALGKRKRHLHGCLRYTKMARCNTGIILSENSGTRRSMQVKLQQIGLGFQLCAYAMLLLLVSPFNSGSNHCVDSPNNCMNGCMRRMNREKYVCQDISASILTS